MSTTNTRDEITGDKNLFVLPSPTADSFPQDFTVSQISPDGTKKVVLQTAFNVDNTKTYVLTTEDGDGNNLHNIFTKTLGNDSAISIPFNTWAPDNKYFFVHEKNADDTNIMVFKADGSIFNEEEPFLDLTGTFRQRISNYNFQEATGWGGYSLIVFNTLKLDGEQGSSFWFEAPSKAVIQLGTLFL